MRDHKSNIKQKNKKTGVATTVASQTIPNNNNMES